ncbi:MAG: hypothetical protein EON54_13315 [Alcaligenaceae bacterium]|nr:MAG: hypothetical protein EON54_13315 [Alcaligenaceae bacterium]
MNFFEPNGVLGNIGISSLSAAFKQLPPPASGQPEKIQAVVEVPHVGSVRITFKLSCSKHHKNRNWFWAPVHAETIDMYA